MIDRIVAAELIDVFRFKAVVITTSPDVNLIALLGRNRSGKSSFCEAVLFNLTGIVRSGASQSVIRRGCTTGTTKITYACGPDNYTVTRGYQRQKLILAVERNGERIAVGSQAEAVIEQNILGMTAGDFLATAFAKSGEVHQFAEADPVDRKRTMMRWFGLDQWNDRLKVVRDNLTETERQLDGLPTEVDITAAQTHMIDAGGRMAEAEEKTRVIGAELNAAKCCLDSYIAPVDLGPKITLLRVQKLEVEHLCTLEESTAGTTPESLAQRCDDLQFVAQDRQAQVEKLLTLSSADHSAEIRELRQARETAAELEESQEELADVDEATLLVDLTRADATVAEASGRETDAFAAHRAATDVLKAATSLACEGFSGECPVDGAACPRTVEINGDRESREVLQQRFKDATESANATAAVLADRKKGTESATKARQDVRAKVDRITILKATIATAEKRLAGINITTIPEQLATLGAEQNAVLTAARDLMTARAELRTAEEMHRLTVKAADDHARQMRERDGLRQSLEGVTLESVGAQLASAEQAQRDAGEQVSRIETARAEVAELDRDHAAAHREFGERKSDYDRAVKAVEDLRKDAARASGIRAELSRLRYCERMCSPDGIPALVLERRVQEIESRANAILDGVGIGFRVAFAFERDTTKKAVVCECDAPFESGARKCSACGKPRGMQKEAVLDVRILEDGQEHDFGEDSGGGRSLMSIAVRLAVARANGARVAFLDECADVLDDVNRDRFVQLLGGLRQAGFLQVFVVSHHQNVKDAINDALVFERGHDHSEARWV